MTVIPEQPAPLQFPLRVPVMAAYGSVSFAAEVLGSSPHVMLLEGVEPARLPPLGTPLRLNVGWDRQQLNGRLAAHGVNARFLVTLGERGIRRTRRFRVDLPAVLRSAQLGGPEAVRIRDLSTSGARVEGPGARLPLGSEVELTFTPPRQTEPMTVRGFVIRKISGAPAPAIGVAFGLASPVLEFLEAPAE
jgi:PilZ domain